MGVAVGAGVAAAAPVAPPPFPLPALPLPLLVWFRAGLRGGGGGAAFRGGSLAIEGGRVVRDEAEGQYLREGTATL